MRRAAVLLAAVAALAGCGTEVDPSAQGSAASSSAASSSPSPTPSEHGKHQGHGKHGKHGEHGKHQKHGEHEPAVPADAPACAAVWKDGSRLARDYDGCVSGGRFVAVDQEPCSFGQRLVRFGDHFYAVRGGPVNRTAAPLAEDRDYRSAIASCRA